MYWFFRLPGLTSCTFLLNGPICIVGIFANCKNVLQERKKNYSYTIYDNRYFSFVNFRLWSELFLLFFLLLYFVIILPIDALVLLSRSSWLIYPSFPYFVFPVIFRLIYPSFPYYFFLAFYGSTSVYTVQNFRFFCKYNFVYFTLK